MDAAGQVRSLGQYQTSCSVIAELRCTASDEGDREWVAARRVVRWARNRGSSRVMFPQAEVVEKRQVYGGRSPDDSRRYGERGEVRHLRHWGKLGGPRRHADQRTMADAEPPRVVITSLYPQYDNDEPPEQITIVVNAVWWSSELQWASRRSDRPTGTPPRRGPQPHR